MPTSIISEAKNSHEKEYEKETQRAFVKIKNRIIEEGGNM